MPGIATVIGGRGFIGQALTHQLKARGFQVWVPDKTTPWPSRNALGTICYCAGLTADYLNNPRQTIEAHVALLERVLASSDWERLIYMSSTRLYDRIGSDTPATEELDLPINPTSPRHFYDLTKLLGENLCLNLGQGRATAVRLACVYDVSEHAPGFLPDVLRTVQTTPKGKQVPLASSPSYVRDYVHLKDVVAGLIDIAQKGTQPIYNLASGDNLSNQALAELVATRSDRHLTFEHNATAAQPPTVSMERFRREFGWIPDTVAHHITPWLTEVGSQS